MPVPIDLNVLLVGGDDFVLDLVGSLLLVLLLEGAASGLPLVSFRLDLVDRAVSRSDQLLERAYTVTSLGELVLQGRRGS